MQHSFITRQIAAAVFDLDGTLLDTAPTFHRVINLERQKEGSAPVDFAAVRSTVSAGARGMTAKFLGKGRSCEQALEAFLQSYADDLLPGTVVFDGIPETLRKLQEKGIKCAIATAKARRFAQPLVAEFADLRDLPLVCGDDVAMTKPAPDMLVLAAALLEESSPSMVYVGDYAGDLLASAHAGVQCIFAQWGYGSLEDKYQGDSPAAEAYGEFGGKIPPLIAEKPADIVSLLECAE